MRAQPLSAPASAAPFPLEAGDPSSPSCRTSWPRATCRLWRLACHGSDAHQCSFPQLLPSEGAPLAAEGRDEGPEAVVGGWQPLFFTSVKEEQQPDGPGLTLTSPRGAQGCLLSCEV